MLMGELLSETIWAVVVTTLTRLVRGLWSLEVLLIRCRPGVVRGLATILIVAKIASATSTRGTHAVAIGCLLATISVLKTSLALEDRLGEGGGSGGISTIIEMVEPISVAKVQLGTIVWIHLPIRGAQSADLTRRRWERTWGRVEGVMRVRLLKEERITECRCGRREGCCRGSRAVKPRQD